MNISQVQTSKGQKPFIQKQFRASLQNDLHAPRITLCPEKRMQKILGFGGAFTESAAYVYSKLSAGRQKELIDAYFHPEKGIGYSLGRIALTSCDFSFGNYTYVSDEDPKLASFSIKREKRWLFPMLQAAKDCLGENITLFAVPWSPPGWMKTNGQMVQGGSLLPQYYRTWAQYFVRAILAFRQADFPLFAVSTQNEPEAVQIWESCIYTAEQELNFVKNYLGPAIEKAGLDTKITIWDHNRDNILLRAGHILRDAEAAGYVWGTAFHWYVSEAFANIGRVHDQFPGKHLIFTEGCVEGGAQPGSWETGERYGRNLIGDLNNWSEGFIDWNLLLDTNGGPNHTGNLCDAPVIADTENDRLVYNSSYYYIAHFSRYIQPGAVHIFCSGAEPLLCTAFLNPDGCIAAILQNGTDSAVRCAVKLEGLEYPLALDAHSISTVIWSRG